MEQVNYNSGEVLESLNNKLDRDFNNMAVNSVNFAKYSNNVTNCITEIPQDINLELVDGTLILKAGSKVYIPNGYETDGVTPKFDEVVIESDLYLKQQFDDNDMFIFVYTNPNGVRTLGSVYKGSTYETKPTAVGDYKLHYITSENKLFWDAPNYVTTENSLPIAIVDRSADVGFTSIDQVFNGFGYIGSTVFALPGVKGLIPNGRNADGTMSNIDYTTQNVLFYTFGQNWSEKPVVFSISKEESEVRLRPSYYFFEQNTVPSTIPSSQWLNTESNLLYQTYSDTISWSNAFLRQAFICGSFFITSDAKISNFNCKKSFRALDHNDSSWLSGLAMPSGKYIDLTLGASGTTYTAPANGWFYIERGSKSGDKWINVSNGLYAIASTSISGVYNAKILYPVKKNDVVTVSYTVDTDNPPFRFIYAEGEK